jgi:hypothetical protein
LRLPRQRLQHLLRTPGESRNCGEEMGADL